MPLSQCVEDGLPECDFTPGRPMLSPITVFCGHEPMCMETGNPAALQKAKDVVERHYPIIGILEYFEESLKLYERALPQFFQGIVEVKIETIYTWNAWKRTKGPLILGLYRPHQGAYADPPDFPRSNSREGESVPERSNDK